MIEEIKTLQEAIETLNAAGGFLNEAENRLEEKADDKSMSLIETAYIEISDVLGYLKELNKENK